MLELKSVERLLQLLHLLLRLKLLLLQLTDFQLRKKTEHVEAEVQSSSVMNT